MTEVLVIFAQVSGRTQTRIWLWLILLGVLGGIYVVGSAKKGTLSSFRPSGQPIIMTLPVVGPAAHEAVRNAVHSIRGFQLDEQNETEYLFANFSMWFRVTYLEDLEDSSRWRVERQSKFGWFDSILSRQAHMGLENFERKLRMTAKGSRHRGT